jgi:molecular chaperone GrpE
MVRQNEEPAENTAARAGQSNGANEAPRGDGAMPTIDELQGQLEEERNRANGYLAQWQRAAADLQNYRRRTEQEREETALFANKAIIANLLPAIDDFDRALANIDPAIAESSWVEGIRQIQRKLKGALEASGVSEIRADGETFDPNIHEAISEGPGDHGKVISELRRGYKLGSRVLRPALVVVGNGEKAQTT